MKALLADLHSNLETVRQAVRPPHRVSVPFSSLPDAEKDEIEARDRYHAEEMEQEYGVLSRDPWFDERFPPDADEVD